MIQRILLAAAAVAIVGVALWHPAPQPAFTTAAPSSVRALPRRHGFTRPSTAGGRAVVYVAGAVTKPGLYRLPPGARAADAVAAAGGLRSNADAGGVNLAQRVSDGDEVFVPAAGETPRARSRLRSHNSRRGRSAAPPALALDVNAAAVDELAAVPGIGRALAARIVAMRESDGAFTTLDELLDVSGMTQSRLERARPYLLAR